MDKLHKIKYTTSWRDTTINMVVGLRLAAIGRISEARQMKVRNILERAADDFNDRFGKEIVEPDMFTARIAGLFTELMSIAELKILSDALCGKVSSVDRIIRPN